MHCWPRHSTRRQGTYRKPHRWLISSHQALIWNQRLPPSLIDGRGTEGLPYELLKKILGFVLVFDRPITLVSEMNSEDFDNVRRHIARCVFGEHRSLALPYPRSSSGNSQTSTLLGGSPNTQPMYPPYNNNPTLPYAPFINFPVTRAGLQPHQVQRTTRPVFHCTDPFTGVRSRIESAESVLQVALVCKAMHDTVLPIFFGENDFHFKSPVQLHGAVTSIPLHRRCLIKHVSTVFMSDRARWQWTVIQSHLPNLQKLGLLMNVDSRDINLNTQKNLKSATGVAALCDAFHRPVNVGGLAGPKRGVLQKLVLVGKDRKPSSKPTMMGVRPRCGEVIDINSDGAVGPYLRERMCSNDKNDRFEDHPNVIERNTAQAIPLASRATKRGYATQWPTSSNKRFYTGQWY